MNIIYDSWFGKHSNQAVEEDVDLLIFINENKFPWPKEELFARV